MSRAIVRKPSPVTSHHKFVIEAGPDRDVVSGRREAVEHATRMSEKTWRPVRVSRADEKVEMTFRGGSLQTYKYSSRRPRR